MKIWSIGQISPDEKNTILSQHKQVYDGYRQMNPVTPNMQPLYVQDFANDKQGLVVTNKGVVKPYTNFRINENSSKSEICEYCGNKIVEGKCKSCDDISENITMYENIEEDIYDVKDLDDSEGFDYIEGDSNKLNAFQSNGPSYGNSYPVNEYDDIEEQDVSGVQGVYGGMKRPYNFKSDGPGKAGPYQRFSESIVVEKNKIVDIMNRIDNIF